MPAKSEAQQKAAGAALAAKRGEVDPDTLGDSAFEMYETMSEKELEDLASAVREDLPETADDEED